MADQDKIVIEVELDDGKLAKGFISAEKVAKKSGNKAGRDFGSSAYNAANKSFLNLRNTILGLGTALAGAFATRQVIEASKIEQRAVND